MTIKKSILTAALVTSLAAGSVVAAPTVNVSPTPLAGTLKVAELCREQRDPIKMLEMKKERVQQKYKAGEITRQEADELTAKLDAKIKKVEEFNQLKPEDKKEWLLNHLTEKVNRKVKEGKISEEKGRELVEHFTEKINEWDGKGYPDLGKRRR
ncbi:hypothetical protein [Dethiobacter alkaliphilus]|uniref:SHOCT domain-containing protein n=1 Tax=Dethiobacter alkaliphilus AHT 1 TaxID=555088 RepID=C0GJY7_DETAL|nr:hypothetical protein [Dethiobacter alkaliphilus]EEG76356.1 conserved hypothetical protein [Dethiobacter alkaliphilus AHT 1]